jgi:catechol 2,3-dioxygenase-like lactoylglutathione lyase family enzyme
MIARRVDHVSFAVHDLDRSLRFYRDLLGLRLAPRPDLGIPGAWLTAGEAQVHLIVVPEGFDAGSPPPTMNPMAGHAAFGIDDYASTLATLKAGGLEVLTFGEDSGQMWVKDPDGHLIELISIRR